MATPRLQRRLPERCPNKTVPGACGCGVADTDSGRRRDARLPRRLPERSEQESAGQCGCGVADTDSDGDGTPDCHDGCPNDAGKIAARQLRLRRRRHRHATATARRLHDGCPNDPNKTQAGACGCGVADTDSDGDGVADCHDRCNGTPDVDSDGDGYLDCEDGCPNDAGKSEPGACGCGVADTDSDSDGTPDCNDACPNDPDKIARGPVRVRKRRDRHRSGRQRLTASMAARTIRTRQRRALRLRHRPTPTATTMARPTATTRCPNDPGQVERGACGCGVADTDTDNDGTPDCNDGARTIPARSAGRLRVRRRRHRQRQRRHAGLPRTRCPNSIRTRRTAGVCGCGVADTDSDNDGTPDCHDACPNDPNKTAPGTCGCGVADTDSDNDGTPDCHDACPNDPNKTNAGACGCGVADTDADEDDVVDCHDNCPGRSNQGQLDSDGDGVGDDCDNCPDVPNPDQADADGDFIGDACEPQKIKLHAVADSYLRQNSKNRNEGANPLLRIQKSGKNRAIVRFDLNGVNLSGLKKAVLVLSVEEVGGWSKHGKLVSAHRVLAPWTEGNGWNVDNDIHGTGAGVTWNCASDSSIADNNSDCSQPWDGGTFAAATGPAVTHTNDLAGQKVRFNVTADVLAGAANGWVIMSDDENAGGNASYYSREGAAAQNKTSLAPRLVLHY